MDEITYRHTTLADVIDREIRPALGEFYADYDMEAIARETFVWGIDTDGEGNELTQTGGFEQRLFDADFWAVVEKHDHSPQTTDATVHEYEIQATTDGEIWQTLTIGTENNLTETPDETAATILRNWLDDQDEPQLTDADGNALYAVRIWKGQGTERSADPIGTATSDRI